MTVRQVSGRHETLTAVLRAAADSYPDAEAYVELAQPGSPGVVTAAADGRRRLTFGQWDEAADGVAAMLAGHGVGRGDVVCLLLPSSIDFAVCYQAAVRLGAVTTGLNLRLGATERASILERMRPAVTVVDPELAGPELLGGGPGISHLGAVAPRTVLAEAAQAKAPALPALHADDPVCVVWTSGSTGVPKGALFDHRNLAAVAAGTDVLSQAGDRRLSPLPFAHVGYMTRPWDEIAHRVTTVVTPQPWSASTAIELLTTERVTVAQGVPTQWALVLAHPDLDAADLSSLRIAGTGAARVPADLVRAMRRRLGCPVVVRYTSTESSLGTGTQPDDADAVVCETVGRPVPGVELAVVDDEGRPVPSEVVGRVRLRSAAVMRGYAGHGLEIDREATATVLDGDGWLTTGDLGRVGSDGNLRLVGRASEMYIRGGYNVYPAEVEAVLRRHRSVAEAAVVGVDEPVLGEIGVAFVVPAGDADDPVGAPSLKEMRQWCRRHLADYKAPDRLQVVRALPLTALGKVDARELRRLAGADAPTPLSGISGGTMTETRPDERPPRQHVIVAGAEPIKLGSMLVTLVEPHRGHEVEYNRWYERDHFYAGCMIGPYQFAGKRFVATADLKALRHPGSAAVTGAEGRGSYLGLYWVLDGYHDVWNRWAVDQVKALHKAGRMFSERDHVHTLLYRFAWERSRDADGLPAELALDHPSSGLAAVFTERAESASSQDLEAWQRDEHLPALLAGSGVRLVVAADPLPLLVDAPGDVPRSEADDRRQLTLWFLDSHPAHLWEEVVGEHCRRLEKSGLASVVATLAFVPTIPGTDTYTDQLWPSDREQP